MFAVKFLNTLMDRDAVSGRRALSVIVAVSLYAQLLLSYLSQEKSSYIHLNTISGLAYISVDNSIISAMKVVAEYQVSEYSELSIRDVACFSTIVRDFLPIP
jgi:hypothetical protein